MNYKDALNRCYELIDLDRSYAEDIKKIHNYQRSPYNTTFINAVANYTANVIYPFVNELSNKIHNGEVIDPSWVDCNMEKFEKQVNAHKMTRDGLLNGSYVW